MFLGNWTKDHFSSREGPILLWSSFLVSLHFHFNPFFPLGFFSIHFSSTFFLGSLSSILLCFCLLTFLERVSLTTFGTSFFSYLPSNIRHLIAHSSRGGFSSPLPPNVKGDPWSGYRKKFIKLKRGDYGYIFFSERIMKDGHFSSHT